LANPRSSDFFTVIILTTKSPKIHTGFFIIIFFIIFMEQKEIEKKFLKRVNFDQYMEIQEWIIDQIERKI